LAAGIGPDRFQPFEVVTKLLPDGVKIIGGVGAGPYEWISCLLGTVGLSYLLADDPDLVSEISSALAGSM